MKRKIAIFVAALAVASLPTTAGAVPPGNSSVPLGSTAACALVATPALPATCNFVGVGTYDLGFSVLGSGSYKIVHQQKIVTCIDHVVTGYRLATRVDYSYSLTPYSGAVTPFLDGVVYTATFDGQGVLVIGGAGTPGPDIASDPAAPKQVGNPGAEDATGGHQVGDAC